MRARGRVANILTKSPDTNARQQRAVKRNREIVEWATDLTFRAGSPRNKHEIVSAKEILTDKFGTKLSKRKEIDVPVWTSPPILIKELEGDKLSVAVAKLDVLGQSRRARIGFFVVRQAALREEIGVRTSAETSAYKMQSGWFESFSVCGLLGVYTRPEDEIPQDDEINVAMTGMVLGSRGYLTAAENTLSQVETYRKIIDKAISTNPQNLQLHGHLNAMTATA